MPILMREYSDEILSEQEEPIIEDLQPVDRAPEPPSSEHIAAEAYAIFERRGGHDGGDLDDWLEAERRLQAPRRRVAS
jgi:hypothetical protein